MSELKPTRPTNLMTIADAADVLAVSTRTVRRLIAGSALQSVRVGRQIRIHPADLDQFLRSARHDGASLPDMTRRVK